MNDYEVYLCHHGVKGMKWGVRRARKSVSTRSKPRPKRERTKKQLTPEQKAARRKKMIKIGAAVAGTALAAYGAYKFNSFVRDKNVRIRVEQGYESVKKGLNASVKTWTRTGQGQLPKNWENFEAKMIRSGIDAGREQARKDSFGAALKNVYEYERDRRRRR